MEVIPFRLIFPQKLRNWREASFHLGQLVRNVSVTTDSGERTLRSKKKKKGFFKVGEMGKYQATDQPEYFRQKFKVEKYGGYLPVSFEAFFKILMITSTTKLLIGWQTNPALHVTVLFWKQSTKEKLLRVMIPLLIQSLPVLMTLQEP